MVKTKQKKVKYMDFPLEVKKRSKEYVGSIKRVLDSGVYILGSEVEDFENKFAKYLGVKYCIGVANGLEAIQIALMAYGIGPGDEVVTTPVSAVATTLAIIAVGATPVFADVDSNGQLDCKCLEKSITRKTRAVISVDLYGQPGQVDKIKAICKKLKIIFIEDAAQAHGGFCKEKKLGSFGDVSCFSFYPTKNLGTFGDGGAIATDNSEIASKFRYIRDYGQESKYKHTVYGLNSRLDELHAAILKVKLTHLDGDNNLRRKIAKRYFENLGKIKDLAIVHPEKFTDSNYHLFVIKTDKRDELQKFLLKKGIASLVHYPLTIPQQPLIKNMKIKTPNLPSSEDFVKKVLSLPCYPLMKLKDVDYVSSKIKEFYSTK